MLFFGVTPCVGVWIEIEMLPQITGFAVVTPCVGVWIEIAYSWTALTRSGGSLPAWECGLKFLKVRLTAGTRRSLPAWECGLKLQLTNKDLPVKGHSLRGSVD